MHVRSQLRQIPAEHPRDMAAEPAANQCHAALGAHDQVDRAIIGFGHRGLRSEEHTSELQSLMRYSYAVFCWTKKRASYTRTTQYKTADTQTELHSPLQR